MEYYIPSLLPRPPLKRNQPSRTNVISSRNRPQPSVICMRNRQNTRESQSCVFRDWKIFWNVCWPVWLRSVPIEMKFYVCCSIRHPTYSKLSLTWNPCLILVIGVQLSLNTSKRHRIDVGVGPSSPINEILCANCSSGDTGCYLGGCLTWT